MGNKKEDNYFILSHTFKGSDSYGYTYEITFNKSLGHTGKFKAIEKALDKYDKDEKITFWKKLKYLFNIK